MKNFVITTRDISALGAHLRTPLFAYRVESLANLAYILQCLPEVFDFSSVEMGSMRMLDVFPIDDIDPPTDLNRERVICYDVLTGYKDKQRWIQSVPKTLNCLFSLVSDYASFTARVAPIQFADGTTIGPCGTTIEPHETIVEPEPPFDGFEDDEPTTEPEFDWKEEEKLKPVKPRKPRPKLSHKLG